MWPMKAATAALVACGLGMSIISEGPPVREKRPEPKNTLGKPLKIGNHRQKADEDRNPYKRHRRV